MNKEHTASASGRRSFSFRAVALIATFAVAFNATATGLSAISSTFSEQIQNFIRRPGAFTDRPTKIFLGKHPGKDPVYRAGRWTPETLAVLRGVRMQQRLGEDGSWLASLDPMLGGLMFQGPGGGGAGGGEGGGEGGGPGGGPGGGGSGGEGGGGTTGGGGGMGFGGGGAGEGSSGGTGRSSGGMGSSVNTQTGNRFTQVPIVGWPSVGQTGVGLVLSHSSLGDDWSGAFGTAWTHSYEWKIDYAASTAIVHEGDGSDIAFTESSGTFSAPAGIFDSLVHNGNGTWQFKTKHGIKFNFNSSGYLTSIQDRNANTVTIALNGSNKVSTVTDPNGKQLTFTYDGNGRVDTVTDEIDREWDFTYDGSGNLHEIIYPTIDSINPTRTYGYNSTHDITSEEDLRGNTWTVTYDSSQRETAWADPLSNSTTYTYNSTNTVITLPGSQTITHNYSSGLLASEVDPASYSDAYTYDSAKNILTLTDKRGKVWTYTYDSKGNVLTATDPLSHTTTITYNSTFNVPLTVTDPLSNVTTMTYDSNGNLLTVVDPLSRTTTTRTYDAYGQVTNVEDALSNETIIGYDSNGNVVSVTDPENRESTYDYDGLNRLVSATDPLTNTSEVTYDAFGRVVERTNPDSTSSSTTYDYEGNLLTSTNELSQSISFAYDSAGRMTTFTDARSYATTFAYNSNGWRTSATNPKSKTTSFSFTSRGEISSVTTPDSIVRSRSYNANGQVSAKTNGLSQTINYTYDDAGRMTGIDYPTGTDPTFSYDNDDRLHQMVDSTGTTTWTYDAASQVTDIDTPQNELNYTFDDAGRITEFTEDVLGTFEMAYNAAGQATSLTNPYSEETTWSYDGAGRTSSVTFDNGNHQDFTYNSRSLVTALTLKDSLNSTLHSEGYSYNDAGYMSSKTVDSTTTSYGYDAAGHLTTETRGGVATSYTYDEIGNRASKTAGGNTEYYTYNDAGRVTAAGSLTYTYDGNSRRATKVDGSDTTTYGYDYENRLTSVTLPNSSTITYAYNALGSRVGRNTETYYRMSPMPGSPILRDGNASYTPGISEHRGSNSFFDHFDVSGNISALSNGSGTITDTWSFNGFFFGETRTGSTPTPIGAGGGYTDPGTGNLNFGGGSDVEPGHGRPDGFEVTGAWDGGMSSLDKAYGLWLRLSELVDEYGFDGSAESFGDCWGRWEEGKASGWAVFGNGTWLGGKMILSTLVGAKLVIEIPSTILKVGEKGIVEAGEQLAKDVPNPWGKRGSPAHQLKVQELEDAYNSDGWTHLWGGTKAERKFGSNFPDLVFSKDGKVIAIQVGRVGKRGKMVAREERAILGLRNTRQFDGIIFDRYN